MFAMNVLGRAASFGGEELGRIATASALLPTVRAAPPAAPSSPAMPALGTPEHNVQAVLGSRAHAYCGVPRHPVP